MPHSTETNPNFILVGIDASAAQGIAVAQPSSAGEALRILTLDTPASAIASDQMKDFQRLFARQFGEF